VIGLGAAVVARKLALHSHLNQAAQATLGPFLGHARDFARGQLIVQAGDPPNLISIAKSGVACRMTMLPNGARQIHAIILPGDAADVEASLLARRSDSIQALSPCSIWLVPSSRFAALPRTDGTLAEAFLREATITAEIAREWIVNLGRRSADQRIAHLLCELCTRMDLMGVGRNGESPFVLTQMDIADAQGLTSVHVNRVMQALKSTGLITLKARTLTVLDRPGLERKGLFDPGFLHLQRPAAA
jgi:CRP-like cAMP-binding protein